MSVAPKLRNLNCHTIVPKGILIVIVSSPIDLPNEQATSDTKFVVTSVRNN